MLVPSLAATFAIALLNARLCKHLPCGHLYRKRHPPQLGHSYVEIDLKAGTILLCCTAKMCVYYRYPLLDKPLLPGMISDPGVDAEICESRKRPRKHKLPYCDLKFRCITCHPSGVDRPGRICEDPEHHMVSGTSEDGVIHFTSKHSGNIGDFVDYGDEQQAQTNIVNSIDPRTVCGQCRSLLPQAEIYCPPCK